MAAVHASARTMLNDHGRALRQFLALVHRLHRRGPRLTLSSVGGRYPHSVCQNREGQVSTWGGDGCSRGTPDPRSIFRDTEGESLPPPLTIVGVCTWGVHCPGLTETPSPPHPIPGKPGQCTHARLSAERLSRSHGLSVSHRRTPVHPTVESEVEKLQGEETRLHPHHCHSA